MLPVIELFTSIQGEGKYMGVPSHFIRVSGCNLRCIFKDSICDTPYASFDPEKSPYPNMEALVSAFHQLQEQHPQVKHVVITGGEPLLYKKELETFLSMIYEEDMVITIETNGTKPMLNPLSGKFKVSLYSVSPKLSTSVGTPGTIDGREVTQEMIDRHENTRINIPVLSDIATSNIDYQFKFVYSGRDCVSEIKNIYSRMASHIEKRGYWDYELFRKNHPNKHTMLMPEGIHSSQLDKNGEEIANICVEQGWTYTDRLQIRIWDDKRGV